MADAMVTGHVGGAGLDTESLTMMLDAVREFVGHALHAAAPVATRPRRRLSRGHRARDERPEPARRAVDLHPGRVRRHGRRRLRLVPRVRGDGAPRHRSGHGVFATFLGSDPILVGATEEQKQRWLGAIAEQGVVFAYGATEPDAGSDLGAMKTTADRIEDDGVVTGYRINGRKQWISNGSIADFVTILARTPDGPSWFVVPKGTPGFTAGHPEDKHGLRLSNTAALFLDDVEVPRRSSDRRRRGQGPDPGAAGVRLHAPDGGRVRPGRRMGGARPRDRLFARTPAGRRRRWPRSRASRTS